MDEWAEAIVESMSTLELCSALQEVELEPQGRRPSDQLVQRMHQEWDERPIRDRIEAEAKLAQQA